MPGIFEIALGILLPAVVAAILLAIARSRSPGARAALAGIAFGAAWTIAFYAFQRRGPAWPSAGLTPSATDWLGWLVLLAAAASCLYLAPVPEQKLARALRILLAALLVGMTLGRWAARTDSWTTVVACFLALAAAWSACDAWVERARGPRAPIALAVAATAASLACLLGRSAILAELVGAIAACLVAAALLAALDWKFSLPASATAVVHLVLGGVLIQGCAFSRLPWTSAALVGASLVAPGLLELRGTAASESWRRTALAVVLALLPGALAVWLAWIPEEAGGSPY